MRKICLLTYVFSFLLCWGQSGHTEENSTIQKNIMILSSDSYSEPGPYALAKEIKLNFQLQNFTSVEFDFCSLADNKKQKCDLSLKQKALEPHRGIDALITIGFQALVYALQKRIISGEVIPIVYTGIEKELLKTIDIPSDVTGVVLNSSLRSFANLMQTIFPDTQQLVLIGNQINFNSDNSTRAYYSRELREVSKIFPILDLRGEPIETIKNIIINIPTSSIVYYKQFNQDRSGRTFSSKDLLHYFSQHSNSPIIVDNEALLGDRVLAAFTVPVSQQAESIAKMLRYALANKEKVQILPVTIKNSLIFNWKEVQQWNLNENTLPAESEFYFRELNFIEKYQAIFIVGILSAFFLTLLTAALLIERRKKILLSKKLEKYSEEIIHVNRNATSKIYAAAIAHELNQPLAAITANIDTLEVYLKRDKPAVSDAIQVISDLQSDGKRATALIERMGSIAKKNKNEFALVSFNACIEETLKFLSPEIKRRKVRITKIFAATTVLVKADTIQLQQVLTNLIINSLDAMSETPLERRKIEIRTEINIGLVNVSIQDTGSGFCENIEKIFESFFTTKTYGLGLGLAISASIIENHGGYISAMNSEEGGALIRFSLPIYSI